MATPVSPRWSPLPEGFGNLLRTARLRAGLPLTRLAASVDASYGLLYDLEAERRPPSVTMAARLSEALHLDPWEATVVQATAVDDGALHSRLGTRHTHPRRPRNGTPARAIRVPTP
ncbi:multiprotein-bridging factor 1 family protein [Streptomyces canus]|uniref:helix-turn-helix domain-containing protein n=1 Tax=Streptomyces canus TaxID=58343 RepID=UPI003246E07E